MSTISAALGNSGAVLNNQTWNIADNGDDATASTACTRTGGDLTQASPLSVANTTISMPFWFTCTVPTPNGLTALLRTERDRTDPLRLGANETYREAITLAADHVGYPRATIAAVISAEAGLLRGRRLDAATNERFFGKLHPDLDSKAKLDKAETTEWRALRKSLSATWDPRSYNTVSKAAGLTQFLESTWIEVATTPGSYVNQKAKELGLVSIANKVLDRAALLDLRFDATAWLCCTNQPPELVVSAHE